MEAYLGAKRHPGGPMVSWFRTVHDLSSVHVKLRRLTLENLSGMSWLVRRMIQCLSSGRQTILIWYHFKTIWFTIWDTMTSCQIISCPVLLKYRSYCVKCDEIVVQNFWCAQNHAWLRCPSCKSSWFMRRLRITQRLDSLGWENLWSVSIR